MIVDSHIHIPNDLYIEYKKLIKKQEVKLIVNAMNKNEYYSLKKYFKNEIESKKIIISYGIHPMDANEKNKIFSEGEKEILKEVDFIGEIGIDMKWWKSPIEIQKKLLIAQMDIAQELMKPVILHTTGAENEVANIIKNYSMKKIVHWYDEIRFLKKFIEYDCYFTINPAIEKDKNIREIVKKVPLERILIETDGIEALEWTFENKISVEQSINMLKNTIRIIAEIKKIEINKCENIILNNFSVITKR